MHSFATTAATGGKLPIIHRIERVFAVLPIERFG